MTRKILNVAVTFVAYSLCVGCAVRASGYVEPPPPVSVEVRGSAGVQAQGSVQVGAPVLATGVTVIEATCTQGAQEACNGLDDNCNGQIDEGCGYQSGNIQITSAWNTGADIDVYVTDPGGNVISYQNRQSPTGGVLDHDARGNCNSSQENNRIENVFWNSPQPPSGSYQVELHYWGDCGTGAVPTTTTLSIAVGGRIIGAYNYTLAPQQRVTIAQFQIP